MDREFECNPAKVIHRKVSSPKRQHPDDDAHLAISRIFAREGVTSGSGALERERCSRIRSDPGAVVCPKSGHFSSERGSGIREGTRSRQGDADEVNEPAAIKSNAFVIVDDAPGADTGLRVPPPSR